ncbi:pilus assembly protein PilM [Nannocystaceae bacterium ST9]
MAQKFVGVDLGNRRVKITVVNGGLRGAQVSHVWEQAVASASEAGPGEGKGEDSPDAAIDVALRMIQERGLRHLPTGVSLPGGSGSYRVLTFPFEDPRQIAATVGFEVDGQFPLPLEQLVIDHMPIKRGDGRGRALVVAVKRTTIEHLVARFKLAGVDLRVITTGALGIAQAQAGVPIAAGRADGDRLPVALVVDLGHRSTDVVALTNTGVIAARSLRRGGKQVARDLARAWRLDPAAAELALERDASLDDEVVGRALQPLLRELEHTRQWLRAELAADAVELRLCGGMARLRGLGPWLTQQTGLPVSFAAPRESAALRSVAGHDWSSSLVSLGTSLAASRRPLIQLFDSFDGPVGEGQWFQQHFSTFAALGVAILSFAAIDTLVRIKAAERERDAYVAELANESEKVFGEPMKNATAVRGALAAVEGGDVDSEIPERGALELLELITKAATPKGGRQLPPAGSSSGVGPDGQPIQLGPDGAPLSGAGGGGGEEGGGEEGGGEEGAPAEAAPELAPISDPNAGIVADDLLVISSLDIRELKIEMNVSATRSTAQDRFAVKLQELGCIRKITKGMIKDKNELKSFEMIIDHTCFTASLAQSDPQTDATEATATATPSEEDEDIGED